MSRDFPDWIDPDKAAAAGRELGGTVPLARLPRLEGMIADPGAAEISFRLRFGLDDQRQVRVDVSVSGSVPLRCQRTLRVYWQEIESRSTVGIVADERAADQLPADYEPLICLDKKLEVAHLIGEELLLGLPLVPIAPGAGQVNIGEDRPADTHRPFSGLAELRRQRDRNNNTGD